MNAEQIAADLKDTADRLAKLDVTRAGLVVRRDRLVVELRNLTEPPSTRAVAELAGITGPRVTQLENAARAALERHIRQEDTAAGARPR